VLALERAGHARLGSFAIGDVESHPEPLARAPVVVEHRQRPNAHPYVLAIAAPEPELCLQDPLFSLRGGPLFGGGRAIIGVNGFPAAQTAPFLFRLTGERPPAGRIGVRLAIAVGGPNDGVGRFDERAVRAIGHVARDFGEADMLARWIVQRGNDDVGPELGTVFAHTPSEIFYPPFAQGDAQLHLAFARHNVLGKVELREVLTDDFAGGIALDALRTGVPRNHRPLRVE